MPWDSRPDALPLDVEECRTALWRCQGNVTKAAQMLKVNPSRLRRFVANSPRLSEEIVEAQDQLLDKAEENVAEALEDVEDKQRRDNMSRFVIQQLGARRGYGPKGNGITLHANGKSGTFKISWGDGEDFNDDGSRTIEHDEAAE